nr:immunoglobulin heavy chain junction region [Macaca mulatta]MOW98199.1 immunoglobulin heavy chain junction region [Macaca mulatta]MOW98262.1 immunoglobulin heavy chain junction region [Macaca mulatta]MOW98304.1 immunoglobulin heavy chain junction region [Macaca mulatta]MOW98452.1 immunoglobulin heavy chain junction region [Macaca mulatta]
CARDNSGWYGGRFDVW